MSGGEFVIANIDVSVVAAVSTDSDGAAGTISTVAASDITDTSSFSRCGGK